MFLREEGDHPAQELKHSVFILLPWSEHQDAWVVLRRVMPEVAEATVKGHQNALFSQAVPGYYPVGRP